MPTVGELFKSEVVEWAGRKLALSRASFDTEAKYRDYLEKEALAALRRNRAGMSPDEYKDAMAAWLRDCACKVYEYGSDAFYKSLASRENTCRWFHLVITQAAVDGTPSPNAGLTLAEMERIWREKAPDLSEAWERVNAPDGDGEGDAQGPFAASPSKGTSSPPSSLTAATPST